MDVHLTAAMYLIEISEYCDLVRHDSPHYWLFRNPKTDVSMSFNVVNKDIIIETFMAYERNGMRIDLGSVTRSVMFKLSECEELFQYLRLIVL